jgi:glycosidase
VFYEAFVRSFSDSDADGVGDFNGLTQHLDHLNDGNAATEDLGVTGIWLMPIFESPSYHGYDVTNYFALNPDYGMMDDFEHFLDEAHERRISVIIDLVLNHSSRKHPWFVDALEDDSPTADWYSSLRSSRLEQPQQRLPGTSMTPLSSTLRPTDPWPLSRPLQALSSNSQPTADDRLFLVK